MIMANFKSRSNNRIWWESQPGNRGQPYPGNKIASKQYQRNKTAGENNLNMLRNFIFGSSDARKRSVEDAVNLRRDQGKEIPLEPFVSPVAKKSQRINLGPSERNYSDYPRDSNGKIILGPSERNDSDYPRNSNGNVDLGPSETEFYPADENGKIIFNAKGGKINLNDCKVSTHKKNSKNSNW